MRNQEAITAIGWKYLVIWQCEITDTEALTKKIVDFLKE